MVFLLLTLNIFHTFSKVSIVEFEQVNVSWEPILHLKKQVFTGVLYKWPSKRYRTAHKKTPKTEP